MKVSDKQVSSTSHGGNVYEIADKLGCSPCEILDYSASINPLGPPPGLFQELERGFSLLKHYPDIRNRRLTKAIAGFHKVDPDTVVVANGSTELIYALPRALGIKRVLITVPTFEEYLRAFSHHHCIKCTTRAENLFQPTLEELMESYSKENSIEAVLLTNPGSPSGGIIPDEVRKWALEKISKDGIYCIVDEVFADYCEESSLKAWLGKYPNLIIVRSMTKFYGIPGLRLGFLLTSPTIAARIAAVLPPWSVNTMAQIAGVFCISQKSYRIKTLSIVNKQRELLYRAINELEGFHAFPSKANFLLIRIDRSLGSALELKNYLLETKRILIRVCSSFEGMDEYYFRVAIRLPEENFRLLDGLKQWVDKKRKYLRDPAE